MSDHGNASNGSNHAGIPLDEVTQMARFGLEARAAVIDAKDSSGQQFQLVVSRREKPPKRFGWLAATAIFGMGALAGALWSRLRR